MIRVRVFDEEHEEDLEDSINDFLENLDDQQLMDIKYQVALTNGEYDEQVFCFSAMIIYKD